MNSPRPSPAQQFRQRETGVAQPTLLEEVDITVGPSIVDQGWDRVNNKLKAH